MILALFINLFFGSPSAEQTLLIPSYLRHPAVSWSDLNGDGILDIWVAEGSSKAPDQADRIWVHNGASADDTFHELVHTPMAGELKPAGEGDAFWVRSYFRGMVLDYRGEQGWVLTTDFNQNTRIRPGMQPLNLEVGLLVPTFDGYEMLQGDCVEASFTATPTVDVNRDRMVLTWPMPQTRDLNDDGVLDLIAAPVRSPQHGEARIWSAIRQGEQWRENIARLQFPTGDDIVSYQLGDLDGDGKEELVLMTRPTKDMSLFDEMSFLVYSGKGAGDWEPVAAQSLKTNQNLWQTGPIEVDTRGITFYYYKGLIRDKFRVDCYPWKDGYLQPKPVTRMWKLKEADRGMISLDYDLDADGRRDLVLNDEEGLKVYYRRSGQIPFADDPDQVLSEGANLSGRNIEMQFGDEGKISVQMSMLGGGLKGDKSVGLINLGRGKPPELWSLHQQPSGYWQLRRHSLSSLMKRR